MASFIIEGGHPLKGEITPQGAKNEALEVICASLLTPEEVIIRNIPDIRDVNNLILLLEDIGVKVKRISRNEYSFTADELNLEYLESADFVKKCSQLRGSVLMIGPLLARFGKAVIAKPGGDKIGRRRLDTHFLGFKYLGAEFRQVYNSNVYEIFAEQLTGCYMLLDEASVTGTANIIMASVFAKGTTTIYNAACEPYIQQLCHMLNKMGAQISGIGSNLLTIVGVECLHGIDHIPVVVATDEYGKIRVRVQFFPVHRQGVERIAAVSPRDIHLKAAGHIQRTVVADGASVPLQRKGV